MRVYYDYQILIGQKYGGISRYVYEISKRLPDFGVDLTIKTLGNFNYYFSERFGLQELSKPKQAFYHIVNKAARYFDLRRSDFDIFHPTYYYASKPSYGKFIVTVHDMTQEIFFNNPRAVRAKRKIIPQADRIIAVSENTKRDIMKFFPEISPEKISVIYHGASMLSVTDSEKIFPHDYVLFVGLRGGYKNFSRFVEAMKILMRQENDIHVYCAGGGNFTAEEVSTFGEFHGRFHQIDLTDEELSRAYSGALCFVYPSLCEGFGIPILEAFSCNCPVICAERSSLPEVAEKSAVYFDPDNIDDMSEKILSVIRDEKLRREMISSGRERVKFFDWDKAARETFECYQNTLDDV